MTNDLIESIGKQLNIPNPDDADWTNRVIYSVAGQLALASLWDHNEDEDFVSIQHFKGRIAQIFDAYEDIYPKVKYVFPADKNVLIDEMYSIYMHNGFLYHSAYKISPAAHRTAGYGGLCLHRGFSPDEKLFMSGLGFYSIQKGAPGTVSDMFGLQKQSFESYLDELLSSGEWESVVWPDKAEFLKLDPPYTGGYWTLSPNKDGRISLARYGEPNKLFAFYRYHNGEYQQKPIPEWRIRDCFANDYREYRRISTALLKRYDKLPAIKVKQRGEIMDVQVGYRLPPAEEEFFKLYS